MALNASDPGRRRARGPPRQACGPLLAGAGQRAARANHGAKDKRLGTSLSKYEMLTRMLPSMRPFEPLRYEGDLETSEANEVLLRAVTDAASALGLDAALFGSSACRRGGATDLRDKCGSAAGKQIIVQRGRWVEVALPRARQCRDDDRDALEAARRHRAAEADNALGSPPCRAAATCGARP